MSIFMNGVLMPLDEAAAFLQLKQAKIAPLSQEKSKATVYCFSGTNYKRWNNWVGPLSVVINTMVRSFLAPLTCRTSIPKDSLLILYMTITQGPRTILMDASTQRQKQLYTYCEVISNGYAYIFYADQK